MASCPLDAVKCALFRGRLQAAHLFLTGNFWNMARKQFGGRALWCRNVLSRRAICTICDICDLPSSPKGAIKIDEICRDLGIAVGKIIFALQQLGLCRDDI
jgi:hypothetical protein